MVTSQEVIEKIRRIIDKHYNRLVVSVLGKSELSKIEIAKLKEDGYDVSNIDSLLELVYNHNFINPVNTPNSPTSVEDMKIQQRVAGIIPIGESHRYTISALNENTKQLIEKQKLDIASRIEGIIRQNNNNYKLNALQNLDRTDFADQLVKESSLGKIKQKLRDTSGDATRDWNRVALTEMGDAIGIASVDRIVSHNVDKDLKEVYVYRIPVNDSKTCKYCRRFYNSDNSAYKIYRLASLLANGSNYGKKPDQWTPVIGSTHPNSRTSQLIEIPPGWKITTGGRLTYIGLDKWKQYIMDNLAY